MGLGASLSAVMGNKLYFFVRPSNNIVGEIWSYDDVHPPVRVCNLGSYGFSHAAYGIRGLVAYRGKLYFEADSTGIGDELWCFDPVANSMRLVADIWTGFRSSNPSDMILAGSKLFFTARDSAHGHELYSYNGITVTRLTDLLPGTDDGLRQGVDGNSLVFHQGGIFFAGHTSLSHEALFRYDTLSGTATKVYDLLPSGGGFQNFLSTPNNLYFTARSSSSGGTGTELYKYDGTNGSLVADLNPGSGAGINGSNMALFGGYIYFSGNNGTTGWELYRVKDSATGSAAVEQLSLRGLLCKLFPNPATDGRFNISLDAKQAMKEVSITISDITGRQVLSRQYQNPGKSFFEEINLSGVAPGMYFVRIAADGEVVSRRVSVE